MVVFIPRLGVAPFHFLRIIRIGLVELSLLLGVVVVAIQPEGASFFVLALVVVLNGLAQLLYPQRFAVTVDFPQHTGPGDPDPTAYLPPAPDDLVLGLEAGGQVCAYPLSLLAAHLLVNDHLGEKPVLLAYSAACHSAAVYSANSRGTRLTFEVAGIYRRDLILRDLQTGTIWQQATGEALIGPRKGTHLELLNGVLTSWAAWEHENPTTCIAVKPHGRQGIMIQLSKFFGWVLELVTTHIVLPGLTPLGKELSPRNPVAGLWVGREARAYPLVVLAQYPQVFDSLGGVPLVIRYDPGADRVLVFDRRLGQDVVSPVWEDSGWVDSERGLHWDAQGCPPDASEPFLRPLPVRRTWWMGWKEFYPDTTIYGKGERRL